MKRIYKNNEKKQRVRILATGELGTVTDRVLMKRSGTPMLYYQVKLDSQPNLDRWYWDDADGHLRDADGLREKKPFDGNVRQT